MTKKTLPSTIRGLDVLDQFRVDPLKIAEWVVNQRIQAVGVLDDPRKRNPMEITAVEIGDEIVQKAVLILRKEIQLLLKSRTDLIHRVNGQSGVSFDLIDQIPAIEKDIEDILSFFVFNRVEFETLHLSEEPPSAESQEASDRTAQTGKKPSTSHKPVPHKKNEITPSKEDKDIEAYNLYCEYKEKQYHDYLKRTAETLYPGRKFNDQLKKQTQRMVEAGKALVEKQSMPLKSKKLIF